MIVKSPFKVRYISMQRCKIVSAQCCAALIVLPRFRPESVDRTFGQLLESLDNLTLTAANEGLVKLNFRISRASPEVEELHDDLTISVL